MFVKWYIWCQSVLESLRQMNPKSTQTVASAFEIDVWADPRGPWWCPLVHLSNLTLSSVASLAKVNILSNRLHRSSKQQHSVHAELREPPNWMAKVQVPCVQWYNSQISQTLSSQIASHLGLVYTRTLGGVVWCGVVWCCMVWCAVVCCAVLCCTTPQHSTPYFTSPHHITAHHTTSRPAIKYSTVQLQNVRHLQTYWQNLCWDSLCFKNFAYADA